MPRTASLLALLVSVLIAPAGTWATTVDDLCSGDPCVVRTAVTVEAGSGRLDFGARQFRISRSGRLRLRGADTLVIHARTIVLEPGALIDHVAGAVARGASLTLEATDDVDLLRTGQSRAIIDLSADVQAGTIRLHAGGNLDVSGNLRVKGGAAVAGDGVIELTADRGDATLGGDFSLRGATGGTGGDFSASAPLGRLILTGDVDVSGGFEAGTIELAGGSFLSTTGTLDATGNSFGADGGSVTIGAIGDVTLGGNIMTLGAGGLSAEGALAGEVTVSAGGILVAGATITSFGGGDGGEGADVDLQAGPLLTITAPIDVQAPRGDGGSVSAEADDVRVEAEINADGSAGGDVTLTTARLGRSTVGGPVTVTGNVHAGGGGLITIEGCDVAVPAAGRLTTNGAPAGENLIQASGQMTIAGRLSAQPDGRNRLLFRDPGRPPITAGANIQPGAIQEEVSTLRPCAGAPVCGNGVREPGEGCDDQDTDRCDGCSATCQVETCGNGRPECDEACDDGNVVEGDACDSNCKLPACGNGIVAGTEECDDGNQTNGDGCDDGCRVERPVGCGDGTTRPPEQCDDGEDDVPCDGCYLCVLEGCGNRLVECTETCDDGNTEACDDCSATCQVEALCGNGVRDCAEQCDEGAQNGQPGVECDSSCRTCTPGTGPDCPCAADMDCNIGGRCSGFACEAGVCVSVPPLACADDGNVCNGLVTCDPLVGSCVAGAPPACDDADDCTANRCDPVTSCQYALPPGFPGLTCRLTALAGEVTGAAAGDISPPVRRKLRKLVAKIRARARKAERVARKPPKATRLLGAARTQLDKLGTVVDAARDARKLEPGLAAQLNLLAGKASVAADAVVGSLVPPK